MNQPVRNNQTPPLPGSIRVRFLKPHSRFAYLEGAVTFLSQGHVELLTRTMGPDEKPIEPFVEVLPEDWTEPVAETRLVIPESEYIRVVWQKYHPGYAYSPGDRGIVAPDKIMELIEGGFVLVEKKSNSNIFQKIKSFTQKR